MKFKIASLIILLISFYQQESFAQEKKVLTLDEAISLGMKNSKVLQNNQYKIHEAAAAVQEAKDRKLPGASVTGSYLRLISANVDLKTKPSGNGSSSNTNSSPEISQAVYGILNVSMPLYAGGRIKYGIESASLLEKALKLDAETQQDEIIQTTIEAYANLFKATTAVKLVKENLAQSEQREKELTSLEKNEIIPRNDLLKAQLQTSNVALGLLDAENNQQIANLTLNLLIGLPAETILSLDTTGVEKKEDQRSLDEFIQLAYQNRNDIKALSLKKQAAQTNIKAIKAEKLPGIQLTGGYIAADIPSFITITNAMNIGIGVTYNIGSLWKTKTKIKQAESGINQLSVNQAILDDNIRLQVSKNFYALQSYRKKIEVYNRAKEQSSENYRIVKNKYDNNLATLSDLLEADVAKLQSTLSYTLARADAFVAYHKLLQSAGMLKTSLKK